MKRDPNELAKKNYYESLRIKKIRPWLFYHTCYKCGMEYKLEPMYEASFQDSLLESMTHYKKGCTQCFESKEAFETYIKQEYMLDESAWEYNGKTVTPITRNLLRQLDRIQCEKQNKTTNKESETTT